MKNRLTFDISAPAPTEEMIAVSRQQIGERLRRERSLVLLGILALLASYGLCWKLGNQHPDLVLIMGIIVGFSAIGATIHAFSKASSATLAEAFALAPASILIVVLIVVLIASQPDYFGWVLLGQLILVGTVIRRGSQQDYLNSLDPVSEHREACPEIVELIKKDEALLAYQHQVANQGRVLVMAEYNAMQTWVRIMDSRLAEVQQQAACKALAEPIDVKSLA